MTTWHGLFDKQDSALTAKAIHYYDMAYKQVRKFVDEDDDEMPDDIMEKLKALVEVDLHKEKLVDEQDYQNFYKQIETWPLDSLPEQKRVKCQAVKSTILELLPDIRDKQLDWQVKAYHNACEKYLMTLTSEIEKNPDIKLIEIRDTVAILDQWVDPENTSKDKPNNAKAQLEKFHKEIENYSDTFSKKPSDKGFTLAVKGLAVAASSVVGLGLGGKLAHDHLFKGDKAHKQFLNKINPDKAHPLPESPKVKGSRS